ncbi:hypothetical protein [uncultured Clostridium sp.]|uniref:hypothetical protein n=1 Tax=uncultured Clostridium sp. TaxID=59620 RepID=UPI0025D9F00F|nr:hypothetical protein [uncultured Clostridium sp.]
MNNHFKKPLIISIAAVFILVGLFLFLGSMQNKSNVGISNSSMNKQDVQTKKTKPEISNKNESNLENKVDEQIKNIVEVDSDSDIETVPNIETEYESNTESTTVIKPESQINKQPVEPIEAELTEMEKMAKEASEFFSSRGLDIDLLSRGGFGWETPCTGINSVPESFIGHNVLYFQTGNYNKNWFYYCPDLQQGCQVSDENGFFESAIMY